MRPAPKPGFLLVARREWRWLLHDRVALILIFGVPLVPARSYGKTNPGPAPYPTSAEHSGPLAE